MLIDTHVLLWWVGFDPCLPEALRQLLSTGAVTVSAISAWEIATKARSGKLVLDRPPTSWWNLACTEGNLTVASITAPIALRSAGYDWDQRDPADRILVATAETLGLPLLTFDARMRSFAASRVPILPAPAVESD
jgi:PIN domain nuclease of toxin-antitoxin system